MSFNKTAIGIFENDQRAGETITRLLGAGFSNDDISALMPRGSGADVTLEKNSKAPEGAVVGASAGAVVGGVAATLVGLGAITIPGLGILLAAGPLLAALSGAAAGAALGGVTGGLVGLGIPEVEAKRYASRVAEGGVLVAVHAESVEALDRAKAILKEMGAEEVTALNEKGSATRREAPSPQAK